MGCVDCPNICRGTLGAGGGCELKFGFKRRFIFAISTRRQHRLRMYLMRDWNLQLHPAKCLRHLPIRPNLMLIRQRRRYALAFEQTARDVRFPRAGESFDSDQRWHGRVCQTIKEGLIKSFDKLRTNGKYLIPFVVSLSNHSQIILNQRLLRMRRSYWTLRLNEPCRIIRTRLETVWRSANSHFQACRISHYKVAQTCLRPMA